MLAQAHITNKQAKSPDQVIHPDGALAFVAQRRPTGPDGAAAPGPAPKTLEGGNRGKKRPLLPPPDPPLTPKIKNVSPRRSQPDGHSRKTPAVPAGAKATTSHQPPPKKVNAPANPLNANQRHGRQ